MYTGSFKYLLNGQGFSVVDIDTCDFTLVIDVHGYLGTKTSIRYWFADNGNDFILSMYEVHSTTMPLCDYGPVPDTLKTKIAFLTNEKEISKVIFDWVLKNIEERNALNNEP